MTAIKVILGFVFAVPLLLWATAADAAEEYGWPMTIIGGILIFIVLAAIGSGGETDYTRALDGNLMR